MPSSPAYAKRVRRFSKPKLAGAAIQRRLVDMELATVGALRALQMDIEGDSGVSSETVLKRARAVLAKIPPAKPEPDDKLP